MPSTYFETDLNELDKSVTNGIRATLGISGLVSLVVGILILAWPGKTAMVVAGIIAVYAAIAGLVNIAIGVFSRKLGTWPRIGYLVLGVIFLVAAVVAFSNLGATAAGLAVLLGIIVGITWIIEGIVGITMIGDAASKVWTIIYSVISIIAGITLLSSPLWGAAFLWLLLGVSLVVLGVVQLVRAFRFGPK
ncbi:HdeD family acid-resistance protein [Propionicimonas sp.]|uniref:HdeD family acid-resistance protein n=1 Tax=Propionicimonas sp. TaxID=1955623 RepID=UPI0039E41EC6